MKGSYGYKDMLAAAWVHERPRRTYAIAGVMLLAVCVVVVLMSFLDRSMQSQGPAWLLLALLMYLVAYVFVYIPYRARRQFRQAAHADAEIRIQATHDGMAFQLHNGHVTVAWSDYRKWKEGGALFLLYTTDSAYLPVPKRFFRTKSDVDGFRGILEERMDAGTR